MAKSERVFIITPVFRMSFPNLFKAVAGPDGGENKKFGTAAVWEPKKFSPKDKKRWKQLLSELDRVSNDAFGVDWEELGHGKFKAVRTGLRDSSEKDGMEGYPKGSMFANLTTQTRPGVCNKDREKLSVDDGNDDEIYAGCYARAKVSVYAYDVKGGKGVAIGLSSVMKAGDGDSLSGGGGDAVDDFEDDDFEDDETFDSSSDDDEDDEAPKKKKKSRHDDEDDDEDYAPKKKKSRHDDEDDEDEEPVRKKKKKSRHDEDDDED